jgi:hypothetical protein
MFVDAEAAVTEFVSMIISTVAVFSCGVLIGWHTK